MCALSAPSTEDASGCEMLDGARRRVCAPWRFAGARRLPGGRSSLGERRPARSRCTRPLMFRRVTDRWARFWYPRWSESPGTLRTDARVLVLATGEHPTRKLRDRRHHQQHETGRAHPDRRLRSLPIQARRRDRVTIGTAPINPPGLLHTAFSDEPLQQPTATRVAGLPPRSRRRRRTQPIRSRIR